MDNFVEEHLISRSLTEGSAQVTISNEQLSKIKALNKKLESFQNQQNLEEIDQISKRVQENKKYIISKKAKIPLKQEIGALKEFNQKQQLFKEEIDNSKNDIHRLADECEKYDQTKAFLAILIEKTITSLYPSLNKEENIHEKLIHSVEENENCPYADFLLDQIKNSNTK